MPKTLLGALGTVLLVITVANGDVKDWYQHATFYQIYPRSFLDSNGDGIGDLAGIISKMKYLADIGIDAAWLSSPLKSPLKDFGYDVSDFYDIQPEYGNLTDFDKLVKEAHKNGIKLMLDLIPNHSSDQHEWFVKSAARVLEYSEFYVWKDPAPGGGPPNNWISVFGGPAWTYNEVRQQYYLHQFTPQQPDLNYRNPKVLAEMTQMLFFWLDRGVDGFRLNEINYMFEDEQFRDEPPSGWGQPGDYDSLNHMHTKDLPDVFNVVYSWRDQMDKYSAKKGRAIILMTGANSFSTMDTMLYYESADKKRQGAHLAFNFQFMGAFFEDMFALSIKSAIDWSMLNVPPRHTPCWATGTHDDRRIASRVGPYRVDQVMTLLHTLPGSSFTYYGEEVAMQDFREAQQFDRRDPNRTPMQWDSTTSAGFSTNSSTWLRVHPDYVRFNVDVMQNNPQSTLHHLKHLTKLRRYRTMQSGEYVHKLVGINAYALMRELRGEDSFLTVLNMAGTEDTVDLRNFVNLPQKMRVEVAQPNSKSKVGNEVEISKLSLGPYDSVVLRASVSSTAAINLSIGLLLAILMRNIFV